MASFLTDLVKPYVEKLINRAITESSYVCCFTCIAKDFENERAKLEVERTTFNQHVDVATRGGEDVQASAIFWEKQADELIQEDTETKKCFSGFCCNCIWQYRRGKELANKKELVNKKTQEQNVDVRDFQETTKTNNDQVSVNGAAFMKVSSIVEE
ncbi:hypothetical protein QL285_060417 [Trifolium repens]|nr:hypothetical protein QL285_060417 [Trifolium repens]